MRFFAKCILTYTVLVAAAFGVGYASADVPPVLEKAINAKLPQNNVNLAFDPRNFVDVIDNRYFPLRPGTTMISTGIKDAKPTTDTFEVTREHKMIMGVNALVIHDSMHQEGKLVEETTDWYAQDKAGNVWYFGEATRALDKGKWTTEGSWEAGVKGARPGVIMQANPRVGDTYEQEFYDGHAGDSATVLSLDEPVTVPYGSFKGAQLTMEWSPDDPGGIDAKYYVKGIGVVREFAATGAVEDLKLSKITTK